jgi:hypothetical protein
LPSWSRRRVLELAPVLWRQTVAQPEVQQRLEGNNLPPRQPRSAHGDIFVSFRDYRLNGYTDRAHVARRR